MYQTVPKTSYELNRERQRARMRREMRRRQLRRRRAFAAVLTVALAVGVFFGIRGVVLAIQANDVDEQPAVTVQPSMETNAGRNNAAVISTIPLVTTKALPIEEPKEPTIEDLLASGVLTDEIALTYDLQLAARDAAETFDVPYKLLLAVMFRESSYNPNAENGICYGLMQIHNMNFEWLEGELSEYGVTDIKNNPVDNIKAGAYLLGGYIDKYEDYHKALMAYNCGPSRARELWAEGCLQTTYSRNVLQTMSELDVAEYITER